MADPRNALPIRSKDDGTDERVLTKIQDGSDPSGVGKTAEVSSTKLHIRSHGKDSDSADQEILLSQEGHTQSNGDYDATNNKRPSSQGMIASDRDASPSETTMNKRPTAIAGEADSVCLDIAMHDGDGNKYDEDNPLAVYMAESPADEVDEYEKGPDVASDAVYNHNYTVTALKTFKALEVFGAASGEARFELQIETAVAAGTFNTVAVAFNSVANPNVILKYKKAVAAGIIIRVAKTNLDNQAQDLYSQITGLEF
jgi:hypothetical protein